MDRLRRTAPIAITYTKGEQPTAAKTSAINNQLRKSTNTLEMAIGDLWNQSGDSILFNFPLQIPNLARMVGESKYMNPYLYPVVEDFVWVDTLGSTYVGLNEGYLQFKPKNLSGISVTGGTVLVTRKDNKYEVAVTGDYWVDIDTGYFVSFDELASGDQLTYSVDSTTWNIRDYTLPGVIPDPRQINYTSCRISQSDSIYYIHLPPRCPLTLDFDNGDLDGWSLPERYPPSSGFSSNYDSSVGALNSKKLWQNPASNALNDDYYRYSLPKELRDQLSSLIAGDALPRGFLYLWDRSSGTVVGDAVFRKSSLGDWVFQIESSVVDFSGKVTTTETEVSYNSTNYAVIAVGSPIARSIWTLTNALMNHKHSNEGEFSSLVYHSSLVGLNPPPDAYTGHNGRYPTDVPAWAPSRWSHDDHVSLLSRAGSQGTSGGRNRDVNDNAMLGDFVLASVEASGGSYLNNDNDSNAIRFGSVTGPLIKYSYDYSTIFIDGGSDDHGGVVVYGRGLYPAIEVAAQGVGNGINANVSSGTAIDGFASNSGGIGVKGRASNGYGVVAEGDTTTPTQAAFRIVPQDTAPSSPQEGDVYINSGTHIMYVYLNVDWRVAAGG